jgi:conserved domain protein
VIGNETMMGQIATFMETLKLTYNEIVYRIPYRNLLLMQKDILHQVTGDLIIERDGRYLLNRTKKEG